MILRDCSIHWSKESAKELGDIRDFKMLLMLLLIYAEQGNEKY